MSAAAAARNRQPPLDRRTAAPPLLLPAPRLTALRDLGHHITQWTLAGVDASVANAMRRTMLARLPVIGIPFEPYAKNRVAVELNTTEETDQTLWIRLGNVPVHSLDPALVTDYAVALDVANDGGNAVRLVTTGDLQLEPIDADARDGDADALGGAPPPARRAAGLLPPATNDVFPPSDVSGHHIALAELRPPTTAGRRSGLRLRATFAWVTGVGAFAPNVVGYENSPDAAAIAAAWEECERGVRRKYAEELATIEAENAEAGTLPPPRVSEDDTVANARHDFLLTRAKRCCLADHFDFTYEEINHAYDFRRAWQKAAEILVADLQDVLGAIEDDTLEYWPAGAAASKGGRSSVTNFRVIGGHGFDVILPRVDHTLGGALNYALYTLCLGGGRVGDNDNDTDNDDDIDNDDSDRLLFCAFHRFTPEDDFGVIRLSLARDEGALVRTHMRTACTALVELFTAVGAVMRE